MRKAELTGVFIEVSIDAGDIDGAGQFNMLGDEVKYLDGKITVRKNVTKALEYHNLINEVKKLKSKMDDLRDELTSETA